MIPYEQIDISGDVGLRIRGSTLEELFANAAEGMFELITDIRTIQETESREVRIDSGSYEHLLLLWLNELVFLYDTYGFIGMRFAIHLNEQYLRSGNEGMTPASGQNMHSLHLKANIAGGIFEPSVNESRLLVKAATYHNLTLTNLDGCWEATVIFDI